MTKVLALDINNIIGYELEGFLELLESMWGNNVVLEDITYKVVGSRDGLIMVEVTANEITF
jgi:hypothetical protein